MKLRYGLILAFLTPLLASCDQLGYETPAAEQAREDAEGKAIGSGCRQTGRALEDCYQINRKAPKAAIFTGWREMDAYMRENKIEDSKPDSSAQPPGKARPPESAEGAGQAAQQKDAATTAKSVAGKDEKSSGAKPAETVPARKSRPALAR